MNAITEHQGQGLILTRRTVRAGSQDCVELWVATADGPRCLMSPPQTNVSFVTTGYITQTTDLIRAHNLSITLEQTHLKTLEQQDVSLLRSRNDLQQHKLRKLCEQHDIPLYEADIKTPDRFLMERFAFGTISYSGSLQNDKLTNVKVKGSQFKTVLRSVSIDIECDEQENLFSIAIASADYNAVFINHPRPPDITTQPLPFTLYSFSNEADTLHAFCDAIRHIDPDVMLGWNIKQFDMAVLFRMARRQNMTLNLGRQNAPLSVREWEDGSQVLVDIPGRCVIDGIEALKTMTYQFERFSLDYVSHALLGEGKLIDNDDKLEEILRLYREEPLQLAKYNFQDCVLVNRIAEHTQLIDFLILRSTLTGLDMSRPGGSVAAFVNVYLPRLHRAGYISGTRPANGGLASPGGYVMSSKPGLYNNVLVLDFKSLYPSIIRTFLIDPLGLAEGLAHPDSAVEGFRGARFSRTKHFLPDIITNLWQQRDEAKRHKDAARSQAIKILMNSFYGVLGSGGCPFYDPRLASSITMRGHEIMQTTAKWIEQAGYEVIYGDTDSTFVHIAGDCDSERAQEIGQQLQTQINAQWHQTLKEEFDLPCHLEIEFETHFSRFFMPTIRGSEEGSKKRYAGLVSTEGTQKLIFKGLENVRSDWTALARQFQEALYSHVFADKPVVDFIRETLRQLRAGELDEQLVYARRLRKPLSSYTRTQPPHVKAARLADEENLAAGKRLKYQHRTTVHYVVTVPGPQTIEYISQPLDYEHYVEKQIRPIADSILPVIGIRFDDIDNQQLGLF